MFLSGRNYVRRTLFKQRNETRKKGMKKAVAGATRNDMKEPRSEEG
jgi:hypothetical protein